MYQLIRPLLFALPPEAAHAVTFAGLRWAHRCHLLSSSTPSVEPVSLMGLQFANRLGLAAGLDKNAMCVDALGALGFGFVEIGTVTPLPQAGNPKPRLFRLVSDRALINRMGFPNEGIKVVCERLSHRQYRGICGVNIGKGVATSLENAAVDYEACLRAVYPYADYVAINISSPNTKDLRQLQTGERLAALLNAMVSVRSELVQAHGRSVPLLVKFTADMEEADLIDAARTVVANGIDGIIATNTTIQRQGLKSSIQEAGGLSGVPLFNRAISAVRCIRATVGKGYPIIGVGGIATAQDAITMCAAGADLVQIYTGLIYRGPALVTEILQSTR
jgi:dihydroorotate dehydrogenase